MKIGIHHREDSYSGRWIEFCQDHQIDYKVVNAYDSDIVSQLKDCDVFMWHFVQYNYKDMLFARQLLFSLEEAGKTVFPDFYTSWHFDDKLGQKYLFESLEIPHASAYAFYTEKEAVEWINHTTFPKVFKLRGGAGGANVMLANNRQEACHFVRRSFGRGWRFFSGWRYFKEQWNFFRHGKVPFIRVVRGFGRIFIMPESGRMLPVHKGYVYFQEFIPNDGFDYRVEVCGDKAIAMVRYVRKGDFRASGGHDDHFDKELIPTDVISFAFEIADKLRLQSCALDIVRHKETNELFLIENSYCYGVDIDEFDHGYWDRNGNFHDEPFNGLDWMVENLLLCLK